MDEEDELSGLDARPSLLATLAGGATIATGLTTLVTAVQLWSIFYLSGWRFFAWIALLLAAVLQMGMGGFTLSGSDIATIATTALTWFLQVIALIVVVYCFSRGLFAPLMLIWALANGLTSLLLPLAIPAALRTSANRRKLFAV